MSVRGGTGLCDFPTSRCVWGPGWFCLWALDLVELGARRRGSSVSDEFTEAVVAPCDVSSSGSECCELLYLSELRVVLCKFS
ncbi:hypothetical protein Taro_019421, partial [Colocasia esculenta]|nr:hypothetical protein [Colocasia esculenta]